MMKKIILIGIIAVFHVKETFSQVVYNNDSLLIKIDYESRILVTSISDLTIRVAYKGKNKRGVNCYDYLDAAGKSMFGNCYFQLWKLDSSLNYQDITLQAINNGHPPENFNEEIGILTYDIKKSMLSENQERLLSINVFDYTPGLEKGEYLMLFFLSAGENYGYDEKGHLQRNSLIYLESTPIIFELGENLSRLPLYR